MAEGEDEQPTPTPHASGASAPPPTPEEAQAEQAQDAGKSTAAGEPSPAFDTAAGGGGRKSDSTGPPTVAPEAAAAAKAAAPKPARPAKEAEAKEAPRIAPPAGSVNELLAAALPGVAMQAYLVPALRGEEVAVEVGRDDIPAVLTAARDDPRLELTYLRCLSGIDWQEGGLEVVYHLLSMNHGHQLTVKTRVTYDDPVVPSATSIFPAADWHERETRDMFGIVFDGHLNLVPLLLPEDMTDHFPLRKDNPLQEIDEWQGENLRDGAGEGDE
ncbi:MAG: NADH-quinone oxidoreductase subunit C [Dehalococcoidia bacterium]|nr:NADH-quinone oxidoreductase subunit C [Dehalococcoidia bacterium]